MEALTSDSIEEKTFGTTAHWRSSFEGFDFQFVGAYRNHKLRGGADPDASTAPIFWFADIGAKGGWGEDDDISSAEVTITSTGSGPIEWMAGAVVEEQSSDYSVLIDAIAAGGFITTGVMENQAVSAFAEAEYSFGADRVWSVAAGARFIREEKEVRDAETTVYVDGGPATGGKGSNPDPPQGRQRSRRLTVSHAPSSGPCMATALKP